MRAIIVLALLGSALAVPTDGFSRIVGGTDASIEDYPFMVMMQFTWYGAGFSLVCGGTLITEKSILSTVACLQFRRPEDFRACTGTSYKSVCDNPHGVRQFTFHPSYHPLVGNDISIISLRDYVAIETNKLAGIAGPNYNLPDGTGLTALGWGHTEQGGQLSEILQQVVLDIVNQEICTERYEYLQSQSWALIPAIWEGMMCAGHLDVGGKGPCWMDAGGPALHNGNVLVGILSWGQGCGHPTYPTVLTRISHYSSWIVENA